MLRIHRKFMAGMLCAGILASPVAFDAAELKGEILRTRDAYVETVNLEMRGRVHGTLWVDESPERIRRVRDGKVAPFPEVVTNSGDGNH